MILNNKRILLFIAVLLIASNVYALRVSRPPKLTNPLDDGQVNQLNEYLEQIWYMQQGRHELDIVTTAKTNARNGEIWIIQTGAICRIQIKANNRVYTMKEETD